MRQSKFKTRKQLHISGTLYKKDSGNQLMQLKYWILLAKKEFRALLTIAKVL